MSEPIMSENLPSYVTYVKNPIDLSDGDWGFACIRRGEIWLTLLYSRYPFDGRRQRIKWRSRKPYWEWDNETRRRFLNEAVKFSVYGFNIGELNMRLIK